MGAHNTIVIAPNGDVRFVYSDELMAVAKDVGQPTTTRASHVEPGPDGWQVDLTPVGGPVVDGFATRKAALEYELDWLSKNWLNSK